MKLTLIFTMAVFFSAHAQQKTATGQKTAMGQTTNQTRQIVWINKFQSMLGYANEDIIKDQGEIVLLENLTKLCWPWIRDKLMSISCSQDATRKDPDSKTGRTELERIDRYKMNYHYGIESTYRLTNAGYYVSSSIQDSRGDVLYQDNSEFSKWKDTEIHVPSGKNLALRIARFFDNKFNPHECEIKSIPVAFEISLSDFGYFKEYTIDKLKSILQKGDEQFSYDTPDVKLPCFLLKINVATIPNSAGKYMVFYSAVRKKPNDAGIMTDKSLISEFKKFNGEDIENLLDTVCLKLSQKALIESYEF